MKKLLIIITVVFFIGVHLLFPISILTSISDNFNKIAIGFAALITAYFGSSYLFEERKRQKQIDIYQKRYPYRNYNKTWKIIVREDKAGEPHVLDIKNNTKYHIWNMKTIYDLGWQFHDRQPVKKEKFNSFNPGDQIRTRGNLGE